jgi:hypothetical protein
MFVKKSILCKVLLVVMLVSTFLCITPNYDVKATTVTLDDYWNGTAEWQLHSIRTINGSDGIA